MHDSYPGSDSEHELFAQLEGLGLQVIGESIDNLLYDVQDESENRQVQAVVLEAIESLALEDMPDEIIAALVLAKMEPTADVNGISVRLFELASLPAPLGDSADRIGLVLGYIGDIADVLNHNSYKSGVQTDVLADDTLSPEVKRRLLDTLDSLSDEEGIDLDDIDQVGAALTAHHQRKTEDLEHDRLHDYAKNAMLASEDEFLRPYTVHPQDPMWRKARNAGITYITVCLAHGSSPISAAALGATEGLAVLQIPYAEYMGLLDRIIEQLATK